MGWAGSIRADGLRVLVRMEAVDAWCWAHCSDCFVGVYLARQRSINNTRTERVRAWRRREAGPYGRSDAEVLRLEHDKWQVRPEEDEAEAAEHEAEADGAEELEVWRGTLCECELLQDG